MKSLKDAMASVITKDTALSKILPCFHNVEKERTLYLPKNKKLNIWLHSHLFKEYGEKLLLNYSVRGEKSRMNPTCSAPTDGNLYSPLQCNYLIIMCYINMWQCIDYVDVPEYSMLSFTRSVRRIRVPFDNRTGSPVTGEKGGIKLWVCKTSI